MKKLFFITLLFTMFMSCDTNDNDPSGAFNLENQIYIKYKNIDNQNLLDSQTPDSYKIDNMNLFYLINNEAIKVNVENGFNMGSIELANDNILKIFTNPSSSNIIQEKADHSVVENTAYIQLNETDIDTIITHSISSQNYFKISKVWYNEVLVWSNDSDGIIEILKD